MKTNNKYDKQIKYLMKKMTLAEKIGQLSQSFYYSDVITGPKFDCSDTVLRIKQGDVGSLLNVVDPQMAYNLQKVAVENSRLHIPLMFMLDVIHGYKIMYPTPLSMACSFDERLVEKVCKNIAYETYHSAINVTFSPMLDYVNDARWGRVNESNGEDPLLSSRLAKSYVKGFQANKRLGAVAKHFVGYGACESGKDYYRCIVSEIDLYQNYLPAFKIAFDNNVLGVMFSFSSLNGTPMLINKKYTYDLLRNKYKYQGFSITDYGSMEELINYKVAKDSKEAASKSILAGVDIEMATTCYSKNLYKLCKQDKKYLKYVNESCYRVLLAKYKLGLFDNPYKNIYLKPEKYYYHQEFLDDAYKISAKSFVMLKNDGLLPFTSKKKVCILGDYAKSHNLTGPWGGQSNSKSNKTLYDELKERTEIELIDKNDDVESARNSDIVILALGELDYMYGESFSRVNLNLPERQEQLLDNISKINPNIVLIIFAGRPLVLSPYINKAKAIYYSFFLGQMTSKVLIDAILGKISPSGKLSISIPRSVGQCPITYQLYHVGRENFQNDSTNIFTLRYIDSRLDPLYLFSEGLSYNDYKYHSFKINRNELVGPKDKITIEFDLQNAGQYESEEIAFLFIESLHSSMVRPYNELKDYQLVHLKPKETKHVVFEINPNTLKHFNNSLVNVCEEGDYLIKIGTNIKNISSFKINYHK